MASLCSLKGSVESVMLLPPREVLGPRQSRRAGQWHPILPHSGLKSEIKVGRTALPPEAPGEGPSWRPSASGHVIPCLPPWSHGLCSVSVSEFPFYEDVSHRIGPPVLQCDLVSTWLYLQLLYPKGRAHSEVPRDMAWGTMAMAPFTPAQTRTLATLLQTPAHLPQCPVMGRSSSS